MDEVPNHTRSKLPETRETIIKREDRVTVVELTTRDGSKNSQEGYLEVFVLEVIHDQKEEGNNEVELNLHCQRPQMEEGILLATGGVELKGV